MLTRFLDFVRIFAVLPGFQEKIEGGLSVGCIPAYFKVKYVNPYRFPISNSFPFFSPTMTTYFPGTSLPRSTACDIRFDVPSPYVT